MTGYENVKKNRHASLSDGNEIRNLVREFNEIMLFGELFTDKNYHNESSKWTSTNQEPVIY